MKEIKNVYIWEGGSCLYCASQSGKIFEDESEIGSDGPPVHKNCSCWISVLELDDKGNVKPSNEKFEKLMQKTIL
ncbi:MAG: phage head morphogenesis protein, partial [Rickettsiales bacterium]|nr:phage head morphogenesis protein [Rickettsiales bacterium]